MVSVSSVVDGPVCTKPEGRRRLVGSLEPGAWSLDWEYGWGIRIVNHAAPQGGEMGGFNSAWRCDGLRGRGCSGRSARRRVRGEGRRG
jgi:hypothetical protein